MKKLLLFLSIIGMLLKSYSQSTLVWSKDFETGLPYIYSDHPMVSNHEDTIRIFGIKSSGQSQIAEYGQLLQKIEYGLDGRIISTVSYGNDSILNNKIIDYAFDSENNLYILNEEHSAFSKIVLQKYSLNGNLIWIRQIQSSADTAYIPRSIGLINDSLLFLTVNKEHRESAPGSDIILVESSAHIYLLDNNGNEIWQREFNPETEIYWFDSDIFVHNNTAYLLADNITSENGLVKVDTDNNLTTFNNTGIKYGFDIQLTPDNNLLITSQSTYTITKTDLNGNQIWSKFYGTNIPENNAEGDKINHTIQDGAGNVYVTGIHFGPYYPAEQYSNYDILTLKYDYNGTLMWENRYQYKLNNADMGQYAALKNGFIYVGGKSQRDGPGSDYDFVVLKIDAITGVTCGEYRYDGGYHDLEALYSLCVFDDGKVALTGLYRNNNKYDWRTQLIDDVISSGQKIEKSNTIKIYPNPVKKELQIENHTSKKLTLKIIDITGRTVIEQPLKNQKSVINLNASPGVYSVLVTDEMGQRMLEQKIVKQ